MGKHLSINPAKRNGNAFMCTYYSGPIERGIGPAQNHHHLSMAEAPLPIRHPLFIPVPSSNGVTSSSSSSFPFLWRQNAKKRLEEEEECWSREWRKREDVGFFLPDAISGSQRTFFLLFGAVCNLHFFQSVS